jgi:hypothetical protein
LLDGWFIVPRRNGSSCPCTCCMRWFGCFAINLARSMSNAFQADQRGSRVRSCISSDDLLGAVALLPHEVDCDVLVSTLMDGGGRWLLTDEAQLLSDSWLVTSLDRLTELEGLSLAQ